MVSDKEIYAAFDGYCPSACRVAPNDAVLISASWADHGRAVLSAREGFDSTETRFEVRLQGMATGETKK